MGEWTGDGRWRGILAGVACLLFSCTSGTSSSPEQAGPTLSTAVTSTRGTVQTTVLATTTTTLVRVMSVPLGDGRRLTAPQAGSVYACQTSFGAGPAAFRDGPLIKGRRHLEPDREGAGGGGRAVAGGAVPATGRRFHSRHHHERRARSGHDGRVPDRNHRSAYQYDNNPNTISPRTLTFRVPAEPTGAGAATCVPIGAIGVLTDGVVLFNALDAQGRDAAAHEVLDRCDGHPERSGQYHRHTIPA